MQTCEDPRQHQPASVLLSPGHCCSSPAPSGSAVVVPTWPAISEVETLYLVEDQQTGLMVG